MSSLKDPVLTVLCALQRVRQSKGENSVRVIVLVVVSVYNRLLDTDVPKHKLLYIFGMFYVILYSLYAHGSPADGSRPRLGD